MHLDTLLLHQVWLARSVQYVLSDYHSLLTTGSCLKMIADYSKNGTVEHLKNGGNQTVLTVKAADHGLQGAKMYIRISNTDTTQGWGGSITWLRVSYTRK